jgi:hypothetical protein
MWYGLIMTERLPATQPSSREEALAALLHRDREMRDQGILEAAQKALQRDDEQVRSANYPGMLGDAAKDLSDRMHWLSKHPNRWQRFGGSVIEITLLEYFKAPYHKYNALVTPMLFTTDIATIDDTDVTTGYVFTTPVKHGRDPLIRVDSPLTTSSGKTELSDRYDISSHGSVKYRDLQKIYSFKTLAEEDVETLPFLLGLIEQAHDTLGRH